MSSASAGIDGDTRFAVASSKAAPLYQLFAQKPDFARWRLHVVNACSFFKVADISASDGKTQITLLHVPRRWVGLVAPTTRMSPEDKLVEVARARFEEPRSQPPAPELVEAGWRQRVALPPGVDDTDEPTALDRPNAAAELPLYRAIEKIVGDTTDLNR